MKRVFSVLALFAAFQGAQATSIMDNILRFEHTSKHPGAGANHDLAVYPTGQVVHTTSGPRRFHTDTVIRLTGAQVRRIQQLIRMAQPVIPGFERVYARCIAPSTFTETYTANHGAVFLRSGAFCDGGYSVNKRPAATKLSNLLRILEQAAHTRPNLAELESRIDRVLANESILE